MTDLSSLERLFQTEAPPVVCETEPAFYALWQTQQWNDLPPATAAIVAARQADRLSWVFTAGYQATLRNAVSHLPAGGSAAFAATEDIHDQQAHPGTTLSVERDRVILDGYKSWVAHSKCVDHLIITVNDADGDKRKARGVMVAANIEGVTLTHRQQPAFLADLSQGYAHFDRVELTHEAVFEFEPIRQFGRSEAKFVMLAATSFMLARVASGEPLHDRLLNVAIALLALISESETSRQVYGAVDRLFQSCADAFEHSVDTSIIPEYANDKRLLRMYTKKIQRRAEYAAAETSGSA